MDGTENGALRLCIFDPTGNITALVESAVEPEAQPSAAARIMARFPAVEQVGERKRPRRRTAVLRQRTAQGLAAEAPDFVRREHARRCEGT